jgi:hypothetical protein
MGGPDLPAAGHDVFAGRSALLAFTDQLVEVAGGEQLAHGDVRPVLVVEGIGGSGRSALLRRVCDQWAGRTPLVSVNPLEIRGGDDTVRPSLSPACCSPRSRWPTRPSTTT